MNFFFFLSLNIKFETSSSDILFLSLFLFILFFLAIFARGNGQVDCTIDHRREVINFSSVGLSSQDIRYKLTEIACNLRKCVALVETPNEAEVPYSK